ncbi:helical backbone metal receptor [Pseudomonas sp. RIT-PI-AD]|uniref:heme/hemin ABC transporter substrate-binding protein n=1 Tax=Pseudomonas sp. RIT-PI-AD TaxID=3035294 RepID=UPI0021D9DF64|nr:helical backbone metal receptor [Pseudomonas sp. RIT-PI-AD]
MRLSACLTGLCASLVFSLSLAAEPLPQRWVSAGGSLSEWVVALGAEDRLVGVDTTSQHPESLKGLPSIGYQRQLSAEGILALRPDILVGTEEMGPPPVLAQLEAAGIRIERLSAKADEQALADTLTRLGEWLGLAPRAAQVLADYRQRLQRQAQWVAHAQAERPTPRVLLLLGHAGDRPMAAGKDTSAEWLIERAGGRNVSEHQGYKAISSEALAALDPEVVIFTDRALQGDAARQALLKQNPALAATRAAREGRFLPLDPTLLVGGLGPRLPDALAALSAGFYPKPASGARPLP